MKLQELIEGKVIIVLIDSASTHNFISPTLIEVATLQLSETEGYSVMLGNGDRFRGTGICQGVQLYVGEILIIDDFLPKPIGSSNVILGMKWLASIGKTKDDRRNLTMR